MISTVEQLKKWVVQNFWTREQVAGWVTSQFWRRAIFRQTSDGAVHAGLPVALDAAGKLDSTFYDSADVVLSAGNAGGQTVYGGTASGDDLTFRSTSHATKGDVILADDGGTVMVGSGTSDVNIKLTLFNATLVLQAWRVGSGNVNYRDWSMNIGGNTVGGLDFMVGDSAGDTPYGAGKQVLMMTKERRVSVGPTAPAAKLHVDQSSTTAAIPVLVLDQGDVSEPMIELETTVGVGNTIEAVGAKTLTTTHFLKVRLPDNSIAYISMGTIA